MKHLFNAAMMLFMLVATSRGQQPAPSAANSANATWRGKSVDHWIAQLADEDIGKRWYATYALGRIGPPAASALDPLMKILETRSEYEYVRGGAAWAIGRLGPANKEAVPLLTEVLTSKHISVLRNAPLALGQIGEAAKPAVEPLLKNLEHADAAVRANSAVALVQIENRPEGAAALREMLASGKDPAPYQAVAAIGRLGDGAKPFIDDLIAAIAADDEDVGRAAAAALAEIGSPAVENLKTAMHSGNDRARTNAVETLGRIGVVAPLIEALQDKTPAVRRSAARALGRLGGKAKTAENNLIQAINDPDADVRKAAAKALNLIRGADEP